MTFYPSPVEDLAEKLIMIIAIDSTPNEQSLGKPVIVCFAFEAGQGVITGVLYDGSADIGTAID